MCLVINIIMNFKSWLINLEEGGMCSKGQCPMPPPTPSNNKSPKPSDAKGRRKLGPGGGPIFTGGGGGGGAAPAAAPAA